jgi:beta-glucanase (GH16 family)
MSQYQIGMVSTYKTFDQTYGAFEVRAKIPNVSVAGLQETLWLYPQTVKNKNNTGEIDFAEFYSDYPNLNIPYIHYSYDNSDPNVTSYTCSIDQSQFNTYDVVWTHTTITILDNGQTCLVDKWKGGAFPFNVEHFLALTQAIGIGKDASTSSTPYPDTTQIDYVRAWTSG